ncbi:Uncharacterised protein [uncultured archaeon]|nr:Uncharacterised protein [uncultured archaeon]
MSGNDCEKFIQKQDVVEGMGGHKNYENIVMAAVVHDIGKFWQGTTKSNEAQIRGIY